MNHKNLRIVCFMCNWVFCDEKESLVSQESQIPFDANIVRVMCIGRVDPITILETLEEGTDGILLIGCTPPDCHFLEGNLYAERSVVLLKKLLALAGLEPERLELRWSSPNEETSFDQILTDFALQMQKVGASPLADENPDEKVLMNVLAAKNAAADFRLRVLAGRERELTENTNVYGEKISPDEFNALTDEVVRAEVIRQKIHILTRQKPLSVRDLAVLIQMKPRSVLRHIVDMRRRGMIGLDRVEGTTPLYKALEAQ
jgi:F420-non-reducing hydrogenase iron-sulfur subunit